MNINLCRVACGVIIGSLLIVPIALLTACTADDAQAVRTLDVAGFSDVTINDRGVGFSSYHGCGESDAAWYETTATNPAGKRVDVTVCCGTAQGKGYYKGCTIRSR